MAHAYIRLRAVPGGRYQVRWVDQQLQIRRLHFATRARARAFSAGLADSRPGPIPPQRRGPGVPSTQRPGHSRMATRHQPAKSVMAGRPVRAAARRLGLYLGAGRPEPTGALSSRVRVPVAAGTATGQGVAGPGARS